MRIDENGLITMGVSTATTISSEGVLTVANTTTSSSTSTGCATFAGGIGVAGAIFTGSLSIQNSTSTLNLETAQLSNANSDTRFRLVATKGATTNSAGDIMTRIGQHFNNSGTITNHAFIRFHRTGGNAGYMSFSTNNDTERMRIDENGLITMGVSTATTISSAGVLTVANTTTSSSTSTGCATFAGGIGVSGAIFAGSFSTAGVVTLSKSTGNNLTVSSTTDSTSKTDTGAAVYIAGGLSVAKTIYCDAISAASFTFPSSITCTNLTVTATTSLATTSGTTTIGSSTAAQFSAAGVLTINNTTDSTPSTSTGAIICLGGIGVAKQIRVGTSAAIGTSLDVAGQSTFASGGSNPLIISSTGAFTMPLNTGLSFRQGTINLRNGSSTISATPYQSVDNSSMVVASTEAMTTTDHAAQLLVLDNTQVSASGGRGGGIAFGGPQALSGLTSYYMAAARIRGVTNNASVGGSFLVETCNGSGSMTTAITVNDSQQTTFAGLITANAGITTVTGQTVNVGTSGTTSPLNVYGLITGLNGLTVSAGNITQTATTATTTLGRLTMQSAFSSISGSAGVSMAAGDLPPFCLIKRSGQNASQTDTLPTASSLTSAYGRGFTCRYQNRGALDIKLAPGTGTTMFKNGGIVSVTDVTIVSGAVATLVYNSDCTELMVIITT